MSIWSYLIQFMPFVGMGVIKSTDEGLKIVIPAIISRMVELLILGSILLYASVQVNSTRLDDITKDLATHSIECGKTQEFLRELSTDIAKISTRIQQIDKSLEKK